MKPDGSEPTRLFFVALLPPPDVGAEVNQIKAYFKLTYGSQAALRSPPHITLFPPFSWPPTAVRVLHTTLTEFAQNQAALDIRLSGFGAFPPRVIYIGVEPTPALMALQASLVSWLADKLELRQRRPDHHPYHPHLTVAFRDLKPQAFRASWPDFEQRSFTAQFTVTELTLLQHNGQRWQVFQPFYLN